MSGKIRDRPQNWECVSAEIPGPRGSHKDKPPTQGGEFQPNFWPLCIILWRRSGSDLGPKGLWLQFESFPRIFGAALTVKIGIKNCHSTLMAGFKDGDSGCAVGAESVAPGAAAPSRPNLACPPKQIEFHAPQRRRRIVARIRHLTLRCHNCRVKQ